jgi:hypothetical protein
MGFRIFFYIIGYFMAVYGAVTTIAYLNFLSIGYGVTEYFRMLLHQSSCLLFPLGVMIITLSIYFPKTSNKT